LAQDLGPDFQKIKEGIYVRSATATDPRPNAKLLNSNCAIILTKDGVVLIDSGENPTDSQAVLKAVKKLTPLPVRLLINTEPHPDHATGNYVFSPPAMIIAHEGASKSMRKDDDPQRIPKMMQESPEMREAAQGYRMVTPQIEYTQKVTLNLGERTLELLYLKNAHSEADTAVWLPKERVLFAASAALPNAYNRIRPFVTIPAILDAIKRLKSLNPEIVVPGHGPPGTTKIFDDSERFYGLLLERVGKMMQEGKSLDQITKELRMPEYDNLLHKERIPENVEGAYRAVKAGYKFEH
jgi:cyclase